MKIELRIVLATNLIEHPSPVHRLKTKASRKFQARCIEKHTFVFGGLAIIACYGFRPRTLRPWFSPGLPLSNKRIISDIRACWFKMRLRRILNQQIPSTYRNATITQL
jgi:hypothetical protein